MIGQAKEYLSNYRAALAALSSLSVEERQAQVFAKGKTVESYAHEIAQAALDRALKLHEGEKPEIEKRNKDRNDDK